MVYVSPITSALPHAVHSQSRLCVHDPAQSACSCLYWAVNLLPLGDALVLTSFTPLLVAVLSPVLIGEVPSRCGPQPMRIRADMTR